MYMSVALHLRHLEQVWAVDGPLQASLMQALSDPRPTAEPAPVLKAARKLRSRIELMVENGLALLDRLDGDPDHEPDADELDVDLEPSLGWPEPGVQAFGVGGVDRED
jgi:hypothetical protein